MPKSLSADYMRAVDVATVIAERAARKELTSDEGKAALNELMPTFVEVQEWAELTSQTAYLSYPAVRKALATAAAAIRDGITALNRDLQQPFEEESHRWVSIIVTLQNMKDVRFTPATAVVEED